MGGTEDTETQVCGDAAEAPIRNEFSPLRRTKNLRVLRVLRGETYFPISDAESLLAPALHRGGDAHRLAVFRDRAPRDVDAVLDEHIDDLVVGEDAVALLGLDQRLDAEPYRLRRERRAAVGRGDRRGEEILELEHAAGRCYEFVDGDPAH